MTVDRGRRGGLSARVTKLATAVALAGSTRGLMYRRRSHGSVGNSNRSWPRGSCLSITLCTEKVTPFPRHASRMRTSWYGQNPTTRDGTTPCFSSSRSIDAVSCVPAAGRRNGKAEALLAVSGPAKLRAPYMPAATVPTFSEPGGFSSGGTVMTATSILPPCDVMQYLVAAFLRQEAHLQLRVLFVELRKHGPHEILQQMSADEDPERARPTAAWPRAAAEGLTLRKELLRAVAKRHPVAGENARCAAPPLEQLDTQLRFERADHVADRGLRDLQLPGRAAEISRAADLQEHFDLAERE